MSRRFWTSDTHFGHDRIIELCDRPFVSTDEMDEMLIYNWNSVVDHDDIVYHLGDVALGEFAKSLPKLKRCNGVKVLVPGNHDRIFSENKPAYIRRFLPDYEDVFVSILPETTQTWIDFERVNVSHFPYSGDSHEDDRFSHKRPYDDGLPLIHGHVHNRWQTNDRQFNVGVDVNGYTPVSEQTLIDWLNTL